MVKKRTRARTDLTESTESLWVNSEGMDYGGTTSGTTEYQDETNIIEESKRIYSANEVCEIIASSHSEVSSSSSSDEDSVYDLSNPEAGAYDTGDPKQCSFVAVPDGQLYCMIQNESTTDEEEQSAVCHAVAKGKAKKTAKEKVYPKDSGDPEQCSSVTVSDFQLDCMIESESSTDGEEQSAVCHTVAKGKAKQTAKQKVDPKATEKSNQTANRKVGTKAKGRVNPKTKEKVSPKRKGKADSKTKATNKKEEETPLPSYSIDVPDEVYGTKIPFTPTRDVGIYLPPNTKDESPLGFFELFFSEDIVADICRCSNEYAEDTKSKHPYMYKHYKFMSSEDFLKLVGLLIHFGYCKIPQYRLAWRRDSLCFDPFVAATMTRNRFESLMSMLHIVDKTTEQDLKKKNDKLAKVSMVVRVYMNFIRFMQYILFV